MYQLSVVCQFDKPLKGYIRQQHSNIIDNI